MKLVDITAFSRLGDRPLNKSHTPSPCNILLGAVAKAIYMQTWSKMVGAYWNPQTCRQFLKRSKCIGVMLMTPIPLPQIKFLRITLESSSGRSYF